MKRIRKISGILLITLLVTSLSAQNTDCYIKKTFPASKGTTLQLSNKYGDVNVLTENDNSLSVCATITIEQNDKNLVQKSIKLINLSINKLKDTISVLTSYDKKFFSETNRQGRKSFSVDYVIKMPAYINLTVTNEFGNVSVEELSGTVNVRISQGIFSAKKLTRGNARPINSIYADHGRIIIEELNWMSVTARNCPSVSIEKAQALSMTSDFSKVKIREISSLVSNSKSDSYNIESIKNLVSECLYSTFEIEKLSGQLKSKATYGSIIVSDLKKGFTGIDIVSDHASIVIKTGDGVSFKTDLKATDAILDFPVDNYPGIVKTESKNTTTFVGIAGEDKQTKSLIRIRTTGGKLSVH